MATTNCCGRQEKNWFTVSLLEISIQTTCRSGYDLHSHKHFKQSLVALYSVSYCTRNSSSRFLERLVNYKQQTKELIIGIHSILQAGMSSLGKFKSRWSNYDIRNWSVAVKKNIPRQKDACSCGIFTIKYMQYWNGSEITNPFSQKDMETFRKKMPA